MVVNVFVVYILLLMVKGVDLGSLRVQTRGSLAMVNSANPGSLSMVNIV